MDSLMWQLILIVVLLAMSAFFSATETAYSSINRARLKCGKCEAPPVAPSARGFDRQDRRPRRYHTPLFAGIKNSIS